MVLSGSPRTLLDPPDLDGAAAGAGWSSPTPEFDRPPRRIRKRLARRRRRQIAVLTSLVVLAVASGAVLDRTLNRPAVNAVISGVASPNQPFDTLLARDARPTQTRAARDSRSVELGIRFRADATGSVAGLRLFRGVRETAVHQGTVWDSKGTLLGRLTFTGTTHGGWQYAMFDKPVQLQAGQVYVASYHTATGYVIQQHYFGHSAVTRGPLTVLPDLPGSPNGVFSYGAVPSFPASTWRSSNYWIDVLFRQTAAVVAPQPTPTTVPPAPTVGPISPTPKPTASSPSSPSASAPSPTSPPPAGGIPAPGAVGFRGSVSSLKVVDSSASAPSGTSWQGSFLNVTASNVTLDSVYVKGAIQYAGSGTLTIRNSIIEGNGGIWSPVLAKSGHLDIRDSTVRWRPGAPPPGDGWGNGAIHGDATMTVIRCDISGTPDGIQNGPGNSLFEQNYIHDLARLGTPPNNTHNDGIQMYGGPGLVIRYNRIDIGGYDGEHQNAALFFQADNSTFVSPQIIGNYLEGGGYTLRLEGPLTGAVVQNNTFGPLDGGFGYAYARNGATIAVWSGNVDSAGNPVPQP
jgi:hypothetical protein